MYMYIHLIDVSLEIYICHPGRANTDSMASAVNSSREGDVCWLITPSHYTTYNYHHGQQSL